MDEKNTPKAHINSNDKKSTTKAYKKSNKLKEALRYVFVKNIGYKVLAIVAGFTLWIITVGLG